MEAITLRAIAIYVVHCGLSPVRFAPQPGFVMSAWRSHRAVVVREGSRAGKYIQNARSLSLFGEEVTEERHYWLREYSGKPFLLFLAIFNYEQIVFLRCNSRPSLAPDCRWRTDPYSSPISHPSMDTTTTHFQPPDLTRICFKRCREALVLSLVLPL